MKVYNVDINESHVDPINTRTSGGISSVGLIIVIIVPGPYKVS